MAVSKDTSGNQDTLQAEDTEPFALVSIFSQIHHRTRGTGRFRCQGSLDVQISLTVTAVTWLAWGKWPSTGNSVQSKAPQQILL